jgi:hypothetical protein
MYFEPLQVVVLTAAGSARAASGVARAGMTRRLIDERNNMFRDGVVCLCRGSSEVRLASYTPQQDNYRPWEERTLRGQRDWDRETLADHGAHVAVRLAHKRWISVNFRGPSLANRRRSAGGCSGTRTCIPYIPCIPNT